MRSPTFKLAAILAFAAGLALAGCSRDEVQAPAGGTTDDYGQIDLNEPYGGLTPTDEPEIVNDEYFAKALAEDAESAADDPLASDPEVAALEAACADTNAGPGPRLRPRLTFLRVVWGVLDAPDSLAALEAGAEPTDWSGLLRVDRGTVVVRRVILFERPNDYLVRPRLDRHTVAWVSHTGRHYDGLVVEILEPPVRPDSTAQEAAPNRLHFTTPQLSLAFDVAALPGLDETFPAGPEGNAVRFTGLGGPAPTLCPKGFLSGFWGARSDSAGVFKGRWIGLYGQLDGFLRGSWGYDDAGAQVFVGKWVSRHGVFRGLLRGAWEPGPEAGHGRFHGEWANAALTVEGVLGGEYVHLPERPGGFFAGRWSMLCDDATVAELR